MKAVVKTEVGFDNMVYKEVEEPKAERDLVKIKIAYCGICCIERRKCSCITG